MGNKEPFLTLFKECQLPQKRQTCQIFAEDAMSTLSIEEQQFTVSKIFPRIGLVRKTKEILADLR
jgi:hypothetical protein